MSEIPIVAKLIDTSTCIGCKACEVACQEWNDHGFTPMDFHGSYQTRPGLEYDFWNLIHFQEGPAEADFSWTMAKYQCMHCADPGCLKACPAPGAIFGRANGIVDFDHDKCIGCGYCITACPFDVPRRSPVNQKVYKCTLCSDRVEVGLPPACIKACPTSCLSFGTRADLLRKAEERAVTLREEGFDRAGVYNPPGVGGTNVLYVLKEADRPGIYGLPVDPQIHWTVALWKGPVKWMGNLLLLGGLAASFIHFISFGPKAGHQENSGGKGQVPDSRGGEGTGGRSDGV